MDRGDQARRSRAWSYTHIPFGFVPGSSPHGHPDPVYRLSSLDLVVYRVQIDRSQGEVRILNDPTNTLDAHRAP